MRPQDRAIFAAAADRLQVWILVRATNEASLPYIGKAGYFPKPLSCKAKTADQGQNAGLVVRPSDEGKEYLTAKKLEDARKQWIKFAGPLGLDRPSNVTPIHGIDTDTPIYRIDTDKTTERFGAIQYRGPGTNGSWCYLHGDYDLYDIIRTKDPRGHFDARRNFSFVSTLDGKTHFYGPDFHRVAASINGAIGVPMIQHAGHLQYENHLVGETLDVFGPGRKGFQIPGPEARTATEWYDEMWQGRKPVGSSW